MAILASSTSIRPDGTLERARLRRGCGCRSVILDGHCLDCGAPE